MRLKKVLALLLVICLAASLFAACGGEKPASGDSGEATKPAEQTATQPAASVPTESGTGANAAVFYLAEGDVYTTIHFEDGTRLTKPENPTVEGKYFAGWFDADGEEFSDMKKYSGDQSFFAKWKTIYTFEAEKTQLTNLDLNRDDANTDGNKIGYGRSGEAPGKGIGYVTVDGAPAGEKVVFDDTGFMVKSCIGAGRYASSAVKRSHKSKPDYFAYTGDYSRVDLFIGSPETIQDQLDAIEIHRDAE